MQTLTAGPISTPSGVEDLTQSDYGNQCGLFTAVSRQRNDDIIHRGVEASDSEE